MLPGFRRMNQVVNFKGSPLLELLVGFETIQLLNMALA